MEDTIVRKKITKALAVCMAFGVLAGSSTFIAMLQNTAIQKAAAKEITKVAESEKESQKEESEKDFLVQTQNKTERKKVIAVLKESIDNVSDTASILKSENILMADLSAKQINELNQKHDVIIEQDRVIEGSAKSTITKMERKAIESMVKKQWSRKAVVQRQLVKIQLR